MKSNSATTMLRWGLAFVFFYAAVASLRHPEAWVGFIPGFLASIGSANLWLTIFSIAEIVLAAWLFWGKKLAAASMTAAIAFAVIILTNLNNLDAVFADIGLAMAALALFELARENNFKDEQ